jgi:hypothetical protein
MAGQRILSICYSTAAGRKFQRPDSSKSNFSRISGIRGGGLAQKAAGPCGFTRLGNSQFKRLLI